MGLQHPDHRFKSDRRLLALWRHGQAVKTSPFHGGITGSIPVGVNMMNPKQTKKVAAVIAIILVVAMVLGAFLSYFNFS